MLFKPENKIIVYGITCLSLLSLKRDVHCYRVGFPDLMFTLLAVPVTAIFFKLYNFHFKLQTKMPKTSRSVFCQQT